MICTWDIEDVKRAKAPQHNTSAGAILQAKVLASVQAEYVPPARKHKH